MKFYVTSSSWAQKNNEGVYLVEDHWDDFGYKTSYGMSYLDSTGIETTIGYLKIGEIGQSFGRPNIEKEFEKLDCKKFFSLGMDVKYYENIKALGKSFREELLSSLNDIAYSEIAYESAKNEDVTKRSFFRDTKQVVIKNQFRRIATGGVPLTDYQFSYVIESSKSEQNILSYSVTPNSYPPTNIHAIIGSDGTGKTTSLKGMLNNYINNVKDGVSVEFSNAIFVSFSMFDKSNELFKNIDQTDLKFSYIGSNKENGSNKSHTDIMNEFSMTLSNLIRMRKLDTLGDALTVLESDPNLAEYAINKIVSNLQNSPQTRENIDNFIRKMSLTFTKCSSGHQITLITIVRLIELIVEKTLIIFDEPETHLHPPLLSALIRCISDLVIYANAVAIMATHSPVVLQEIPRSCVSIIRKNGEYTVVSRPSFETFGENIAVLTEDIFGLEIRNTGYHTLLKKYINLHPDEDYNDILDEFKNELSIEAKSIIRNYINLRAK